VPTPDAAVGDTRDVPAPRPVTATAPPPAPTLEGDAGGATDAWSARRNAVAGPITPRPLGIDPQSNPGAALVAQWDTIKARIPDPGMFQVKPAAPSIPAPTTAAPGADGPDLTGSGTPAAASGGGGAPGAPGAATTASPTAPTTAAPATAAPTTAASTTAASTTVPARRPPEPRRRSRVGPPTLRRPCRAPSPV
jgi:hypothetical protein